MLTVNKYLYVIGAGILQAPTIEEAHKMGLGVVLTSSDFQTHGGLGDLEYKISTKDIAGNLLCANSLKGRIVGVYTQGHDVEYTVAKVAEWLGLYGISVSSAYNCNNKANMRSLFKVYEIPQPEFIVVNSYEEAKKKIKIYPIVVKSIDNSASRGITIVQKEEDLEVACQKALEFSQDKRILLEEFIEGEEYSVDTIIYQDKLYPCGISDREFLVKDNFAIQCGSLTPSLLPAKQQVEIYELMDKARKALDVTMGAFKGDVIIDKNGKIYLLEVTARLSGGFDSQYRKPLSFGVNLVKATIDLAIGNELDFKDIIPKFVKYSKTFSIFPKPGIVKEIKGLEELKATSGIKQVFLNTEIGKEVKDPKHCADRVVHIVGVADTLEKLTDLEFKANETLQIITE